MQCPKCSGKRFAVGYTMIVDAFVEDDRVDRIVSQINSISDPQAVTCVGCWQEFEAEGHEAVKIAQEAEWPSWESE